MDTLHNDMYNICNELDELILGDQEPLTKSSDASSSTAPFTSKPDSRSVSVASASSGLQVQTYAELQRAQEAKKNVSRDFDKEMVMGQVMLELQQLDGTIEEVLEKCQSVKSVLMDTFMR